MSDDFINKTPAMRDPSRTKACPCDQNNECLSGHSHLRLSIWSPAPSESIESILLGNAESQIMNYNPIQGSSADNSTGISIHGDGYFGSSSWTVGTHQLSILVKDLDFDFDCQLTLHASRSGVLDTKVNEGIPWWVIALAAILCPAFQSVMARAMETYSLRQVKTERHGMLLKTTELSDQWTDIIKIRAGTSDETSTSPPPVEFVIIKKGGDLRYYGDIGSQKSKRAVKYLVKKPINEGKKLVRNTSRSVRRKVAHTWRRVFSETRELLDWEDLALLEELLTEGF